MTKNEIFKAAGKNDIDTIEKYLKEGGDPNIQDKDGWGLLYKAITLNQLDIAKLLLEYGGNLTIKDKKGKTPLDYSPKFKEELAKNYLGNLGKLL